MTTTERMTGYRDYTVVGTPAHLANVIANHTNNGTLVEVTAARPVSATAVTIRLRLRETTTAPAGNVRATTAQGRRAGRAIAWAVTTAGAITGLLAVAAYLIGQLVELVAAHAGLILGVLALTVITAALLLRSGSGRRHCPGC